MARVMIEQVFAAPMSDDALAELSVRVTPCLDARRATWRRTYLSSDRLRMTCEYEAPDAESVREACRAAGVAFERVWAAYVFSIEEQPQMKEQLAERHARARKI